MKRFLSRLCIAATLVACSSATPAPEATDAGPTGPGPATDPSCEQTPSGCLVFRCNCANGNTSRTFADKKGGGCLSGAETCAQICPPQNSSVVTPVNCNKRVEVEAGAPAPAPAVDAGPKTGRPGGACETNGPPCLVTSCTCTNGSNHTNSLGICRNGVCASLAESCAATCSMDGGWSGKGMD